MILAAAVIIVAVSASRINRYNFFTQRAENYFQHGFYYAAYTDFCVVIGEERARKRMTKEMRDAVLNVVKTEEYKKVVNIWRYMPEYIDDKTQVDRKLADAMYQVAEQYVNTGKYDEAERVFCAFKKIRYTDQKAAGKLVNAMYQHAGDC